MWVLMGRSDDFPPGGSSPAELVRFAQEQTAGWDPRTTTVLPEAIVADTFLTPLRAMPEIPEIPAHAGVPVAFLGDAIHAMSPAHGEGANTAFGDAALLVSHVLNDNTVTDAVAGYHADMRVTAGEAILRSASYGAPEASNA
ncbi:FAD-dependent monooxygenase [Fodinicola feengrottensis]|nr:FAD-dependent monooxygenase [Fodinicola feengrottensis]